MKKTKLFFTGVLLILLMSLIGCAKNIEIRDIMSFRFSYSTGYMMNASVAYTLELKDGVYTATVKPNLVPEEEASVFTVDKAFADELEEFLRSEKVSRWNGFNKSDDRVLDGNSFGLSIVTNDREIISAHGYMKYPKNYSAVRSGIESIFGKLMQ